MLKIGLIDANEMASREYSGMAGSVVSGWLEWEMSRVNVTKHAPQDADIILLVFSGALDWLSNCKAYLRKHGIISDAHTRGRRPYIIAGGPSDAIPFTALTIADAITVGEAYNFVRLLFSEVQDGRDIQQIRDWIIEYPHAIERSQIDGLRRDATRPWLLAEPAPKLARPDDYVDWNTPPVRSSDKVVRIIAEKGCHCKCLFCATTYRQTHRQNDNDRQVISTLATLKAKGERVQLVSNDPMNLPYFRRITTKLDSQSFTIMEVSDNENRAAIIKSGVGIARFGVEGISERIRNAFAKPIKNDHLLDVLAELHANKINTHLFFIVGSPGETVTDWNEFREFYDRLSRAITWGICRIKFTTFVSTPPAPLARFVPNLEYETNMDIMRKWISANAASKHLVYVRGRGGKTHIDNVAEQLSVNLDVARGLVGGLGSTDLAPTLDDAQRLPWEVIAWPIPLEMRYKIASTYARRMDIRDVRQ